MGSAAEADRLGGRRRPRPRPFRATAGLPRAIIGISTLLGLAPPSAAAQTPPLRAYWLDVASASSAGPLNPATAADFQRLRLMATPALGPLRLDLAYEHTLLWSDSPETSAPGLEAAPRRDLDWLVHAGPHVRWRHRFDRLSVALPLPHAEVTVGRQAVSWATTLFLTPADPFSPFDPSDPFREYRAGVDAARAQWFPGPFSSVDLVLRTAASDDGRTRSVLLRGRTTLGSWSTSAWAGSLDGHAAASAAAEGAVGAWALRGEVEVRRTGAGATVARAAVGTDRRLSVLDRDLYLVLELQRDGLAPARARELPGVLTSDPFRRGQIQLLARDAAAADASWQIHPLLGLEFLLLADLDRGSALLAPAASVSLSNESTLRAGLYLPAGSRSLAAPAVPATAFGATPETAYLSLTLFF